MRGGWHSPLPTRDKYTLSPSPLAASSLGRFGSLQCSGGFVHVLDDLACIPHFVELDTITDFVEYLAWREALPKESEPSSDVGEEDYLAVYLSNNRISACAKPPESGDFIRYFESQEHFEHRQADPPGFFWDALILHIWSQLPRFLSHGGKIGTEVVRAPTAGAMDRILREMATHPRAERRFLGAATYLLFTEDRESRARVLRAPRGPGYVLMRRDSVNNVQKIQEELFGRCVYAQEMMMPDRDVLGLASTPALVALGNNVPIVLTFLQGSVKEDSFGSKVRELGGGRKLVPGTSPTRSRRQILWNEGWRSCVEQVTRNSGDPAPNPTVCRSQSL